MKLMIMTDMEGVAGMLNFDDWCVPDGRSYDRGKRLLTLEVNAAIEGFFQGGATEILVVDGHGNGGIDPELLDERAQLMRGRGERVHAWGLDESFDGLAHVGQHAKAGTPYSQMTHTQGWNYIDLAVNGISVGEFGQLALCAKELGVPAILATGEQAFAEEAAALTPGIVTVAVKRGLLPDGLDHLIAEDYCKAKLSAVHLSPGRARKLIWKGALEAITKLKEAPDSFSYPDLKPPYVRTARFRGWRGKSAYAARDEHPDSLIEMWSLPFTKVD
ncbi:MAG: M55 family metallopeptidase [bacterium]|nr:M55 family metallopeptidase [bacterium]